MMAGTRYLQNQYSVEELNGDLASYIPIFEQFLEEARGILINELNSIHSEDLSLYTGKVGVAITVARLTGELPALRYPRGILEKASDQLGFCSNHYCSSLHYHLQTNTPIKRELRFFGGSQFYNEILYGRAGLGFLVHYYQTKGLQLEDPNLIQKIIKEIPLNEFPWSWNRKEYLGGAHGAAGILLAIAKLSDHDKKYSPDLLHSLLDLGQLESGNLKSRCGSSQDELVQWCHGATGLIPLLLEYIYIGGFQDTRFFDALEKALQVIWTRGLLLKGCSICHGVAGNGYCFLAAYLKTKNHLYLQQAVLFALHCCQQTATQCCANADHPNSLFEGLAGTVHFILDIVYVIETASSKPETLSSFELFDGIGIF
jgi:hypothetical protein